MKCRSCGFEIADKAIVCYRCGTPTAEPSATPRVPPRRSRWLPVVLSLAIAAIVAWRIPTTAPGSWARVAGWVVLVVSLAVIPLWLRGPRPPGRAIR